MNMSFLRDIFGLYESILVTELLVEFTSFTSNSILYKFVSIDLLVLLNFTYQSDKLFQVPSLF